MCSYLPTLVGTLSTGCCCVLDGSHRTGLWGFVGTPDASIPSIGAVLPHKSPHQPPKIQAAEYLMLPPTACVGCLGPWRNSHHPGGGGPPVTGAHGIGR